jgi:hypothetical protein
LFFGAIDILIGRGGMLEAGFDVDAAMRSVAEVDVGGEKKAPRRGAAGYGEKNAFGENQAPIVMSIVGRPISDAKLKFLVTSSSFTVPVVAAVQVMVTELSASE